MVMSERLDYAVKMSSQQTAIYDEPSWSHVVDSIGMSTAIVYQTLLEISGHVVDYVQDDDAQDEHPVMYISGATKDGAQFYIAIHA